MPGYAYPVGTTTTDYPAKTVVATIDVASSATIANLVTVFTATAKTKVNSLLVTNLSGGILPVDIYVNTDKITSVRVYKEAYAVLPLISGDTRISGTSVDILTEFFLAIGDTIEATSRVADVINISLYLSEGVK